MLDKNIWENLVGLGYKHRGRGPTEYDCLGLLVEIFKRMGIDVYDPVYSNDDAERSRLLSLMPGNWKRTNIKSGCALLFCRRVSRLPSHVGVSIDEDRFIHATEDCKQVIISRLSSGYNKLLIGAYEYAVLR